MKLELENKKAKTALFIPDELLEPSLDPFFRSMLQNQENRAELRAFLHLLITEVTGSSRTTIPKVCTAEENIQRQRKTFL